MGFNFGPDASCLTFQRFQNDSFIEAIIMQYNTFIFTGYTYNKRLTQMLQFSLLPIPDTTATAHLGMMIFRVLPNPGLNGGRGADDRHPPAPPAFPSKAIFARANTSRQARF
jgi:hypothetical protein